MQLENLRDFAKRHPVPVNPGHERAGGHGSGMAQTFSAQVSLSAHGGGVGVQSRLWSPTLP